MLRNAYASVAAVAAALALVGSTSAASAGSHRTYKAQRDYVRSAPVKDCTRLNGRYGYYGNPWCTPQEQARFDRWSANKRMWR